MAACLTTDNTNSTARAIEIEHLATSHTPYFPPPEEDDEQAYQNRRDYLRQLLEQGQTWDVPHWRPLRWLVGLVLNLAWLQVRPWRRPRCDIP